MRINLYGDRKLQNLAKRLGLETKITEGWRYGYRVVTDRYLEIEGEELKKWQNALEEAKKKAVEKERRRLAKIEKDARDTQKVIEALYSINKEAKKWRDAFEDALEDACVGLGLDVSDVTDLRGLYDFARFEAEPGDRAGFFAKASRLGEASAQRRYYYALKGQAIAKLREMGALQAVGWHRGAGGEALLLLEGGGHSFHVPVKTQDELGGAEYLGELDDKIDAGKERGAMSASRAEQIIEKFLKN